MTQAVAKHILAEARRQKISESPGLYNVLVSDNGCVEFIPITEDQQKLGSPACPSQCQMFLLGVSAGCLVPALRDGQILSKMIDMLVQL